MTPFYWLVALAVLLVIEIITLGLTTIWFAGGALVAFVLALLGVPWLVQIAVFLIVSILLLIFTRPAIEKKINKDRVKTNVNSIAGKEGKVTEDIDNFNQKGAIVLNGLEWTARSSKDDVIIPAGARVVVDEVKGVKVFVSQL
ncbi:MAG: NfeD family protein [Lachnospiraceae bacterium]|nr:NfeD family protein [Lachnospiraceae bacterium]